MTVSEEDKEIILDYIQIRDILASDESKRKIIEALYGNPEAETALTYEEIVAKKFDGDKIKPIWSLHALIEEDDWIEVVHKEENGFWNKKYRLKEPFYTKYNKGSNLLNS